ncbi:uncharacterized protein LOC115589858 [Sparus aurata]|uniref:uncharacterized protein LOC115589858 n=1 Tax=Sparus aurata TaxID=8175 RepID=UPI0011C1AD4E|nr:uncharacterized protein LOC115589858 [Sparus aurata]
MERLSVSTEGTLAPKSVAPKSVAPSVNKLASGGSMHTAGATIQHRCEPERLQQQRRRQSSPAVNNPEVVVEGGPTEQRWTAHRVLMSGDDVVDDPNGVTYAVVVTKQRMNTDTADAADNLSLHLETNHSRNPQSEGDEDESSYQLVYSAVTMSKTPKPPESEPGLSSSTVTLNPSAATDPNSTESEVLYSAVRMAKKTPE